MVELSPGRALVTATEITIVGGTINIAGATINIAGAAINVAAGAAIDVKGNPIKLNS
ncbi:MAG: hypothetical protein IT373_18805 [Polyangiaceae bacterium]|nr:hypothetical protein [Polyangiaceae bacterium]